MSVPFPYLGPIPPETNPAIKPQYYEPSRFVISALATGTSTTITTSTDNNYVVGGQVRVLIPQYYGTYQINGQTGFITSLLSSSQFIVNIDSSNANAFISNPVFGPDLPQVVAVGDVNTGAINANGSRNQTTFIEGSFINVSPN